MKWDTEAEDKMLAFKNLSEVANDCGQEEHANRVSACDTYVGYVINMSVSGEEAFPGRTGDKA